jgi:5-methylcytosine-specific restriction endonuclease McrA
MPVRCVICGKRAYSDHCVAHKPRKPLASRGKRTVAYEKWRDKVAKPFLDDYRGRKCAVWNCKETEDLDVDHIKGRGSHPELKMELTNVQYLCRVHHRLKTDGLPEGV